MQLFCTLFFITPVKSVLHDTCVEIDESLEIDSSTAVIQSTHVTAEKLRD